jgi:hypothetical protein
MLTDYPSLTINMRGSKANSPLIIIIAEKDHGDMSYSSLLRQVIEDCGSNGLSTKVFSEFESQTYKVNGMANNSRDDAIDGAPVDIERQLAVLRNVPSKETHIETTEFLDHHIIAMGGVKKRWRELVPQTWEKLPEEIRTGTPENLLLHFEERGAIDNPAILKMMRDDVTKGELPREDGVMDANTNAKSYYDYWGGCLNYKLIHQGMAQDVKKGLAGYATPDAIIIIAGKDHILGLSEQFDLHLPQFADSQKVVIRNSKEVVIDGVGRLIEFEFDQETKKAHIPELLSEIMSQKSLSKRISSQSEKLSPEKSWGKRMRSDSTSDPTEGKKGKGGSSEL